jgi:NADH:ubiquinone oxidoreductase subunit F (NADH-binding)
MSSCWGPLPEVSGERVRQLVQDSGLTGRGGAGFPTARKLAAVAGRRRAVVVANGAEGEPASSKDRVLLLRAPHLVLDGVAVAVRATGATEAFLYAPDDLADRLQDVIRQRADPVGVSLIRAASSFIAGQETAAVAAVEGRPAVPGPCRRCRSSAVCAAGRHW